MEREDFGVKQKASFYNCNVGLLGDNSLLRDTNIFKNQEFSRMDLLDMFN